MFLLSFAYFFFQNNFQKILPEALSASNSLDQYHDLHSVSPDLGLNCLQRLSAVSQKSLQAWKNSDDF